MVFIYMSLIMVCISTPALLIFLIEKGIIMNNNPTLLILFCISFISSSCFANDKQKIKTEKHQLTLNKETNKAKKKTDSKNKPLNIIKYSPPFLGAPSLDRLNAMGTRQAAKQHDLLFSLLTPTHTGLTSQPQPNLYWFTSKPVSKPFQFIEFVLNSERSLTPILRTRLPQLEKSGIHQLNLADYDISLKPEIEYSWSIALIKNPEIRSIDLVSKSKIKYVKPDKSLQQKLKESSTNQKASIYAKKGYWYEAISTAVQQQKEQPDHLTHLINQITLQKIADHIVKDWKYNANIQTTYSMQPSAIIGD